MLYVAMAFYSLIIINDKVIVLEGRCALNNGTATIRGCLLRDFLTIGSTRQRFFRRTTCMSHRDRSQLDRYSTWRNAALALAPLIRLFVYVVSLMSFLPVMK